MENIRRDFDFLTMNNFILNIINTFFLFTSTTLLFIGVSLGTATACVSLFFLVVLNARKTAIEIVKMFRIATGKEKLINREKPEA